MRVVHQAQKDSIGAPDSDEEEGAEGAARAFAGEGPLQAQDEGKAGSGDLEGVREREETPQRDGDVVQGAKRGRGEAEREEEEDHCEQHLLRALLQIVPDSVGAEEAR